MSDKRACRWCDERVWVADECRRCARARISFDKALAELLSAVTPSAAFQMVYMALKAVRSAAATERAQAPNMSRAYRRAWEKRREQEREMSKYFTKTMENAQK